MSIASNPGFAQMHEHEPGHGLSLFEDPAAPGASTRTARAMPGAWRSTSIPASAAAPASSPARPRTTSRSSAASRCSPRARCTGSASIATSRETDAGNPDDRLSAGALHALREGPVRGRLPGRGDDAQRRGAQRDDVQPLRRHALLLEQLPVQGPAVQLPPVFRRDDAQPEADAQPRRDRAAARGDGEVHILRAADQRGADQRRDRESRRWAATRS